MVFWRVRSWSGVSEVTCAVAVLARGEVPTAWSETGALGSEGRAVGERRKEFLRMPVGIGLDSWSVLKDTCLSVPFGR